MWGLIHQILQKWNSRVTDVQIVDMRRKYESKIKSKQARFEYASGSYSIWLLATLYTSWYGVLFIPSNTSRPREIKMRYNFNISIARQHDDRCDVIFKSTSINKLDFIRQYLAALTAYRNEPPDPVDDISVDEMHHLMD